MHHIIDYYGKYTVAQNLDQIAGELQQYKDSLIAVLNRYGDDGALKTSLTSAKKKISAAGWYGHASKKPRVSASAESLP